MHGDVLIDRTKAERERENLTELPPEDHPRETRDENPTSSLVEDLVEALKSPGQRGAKLRRFLSVMLAFGTENARLLPRIKRSFFRIFAIEIAILLIIDIASFWALPLYAWLPATVLSTLMAAFTASFVYLQLGLVRRDDGTPHTWFLLPNAMSLMRILFIPHLFFIIPFMEYDPLAALLALVLYTYAATSDALDGQLSRIFDQQSIFGRIYDPIFDIVFNSAIALALAIAKLIPLWMASLIFMRYWLPVAGGVILYLYHKPFIVMPTGIGKVTGFVLAFVLGFPILQAATLPPFPPEEVVFYGLVLAGILILVNTLYIIYRGVRYLLESESLKQ